MAWDEADEQGFHEQFKSLHVRGEWFASGPPLLKYIAAQNAGESVCENVGEGENVVPPARFQRATFRLGGGRSMQLSYGSSKVDSIQQTAISRQLFG